MTSTLSPAKRALLERWKRGQSDPAGIRRIAPRGGGGPAALSFAQERIWTLHRLAPDLPINTITFAVELPMAVDPGLLGRALNEVVRRHEILRTTFRLREGAPVQEVGPELVVGLHLADLRHLGAGEQEARTRRLVELAAGTPFDIERGPLLRAQLLRLGEEQFRFLVSLHHLVADSFSIGVLGTELLAIARALASGRPSPLPPPALQYADYAVWQRSPAEEARRAGQLAFWREHLGQLPPALELPTDRPRPTVLAREGGGHTFWVPPALAAGLRALGRSEGATLFMTVLSAFAVLLHRYSGRPDIVVGSPVLGRSQPELAELIGCFINMVPLRIDLSSDPDFTHLLRRVRQTVSGAFSNQEVPIERLVGELRVRRDPSRMPLFQAMFNWHGADPEQVRGAGIPLREVSRLSTGAIEGYDLVLDVFDRDGGLRATLEFPTALFDRATVERMARQFEHLLAEVVADPGRPLSRLPMVAPSELQACRSGWDGPFSARPAACLHELFEAQARRSPQAVAVVFERHELRYAELNRRANQVAHRLRELGIGPQGLVGIACERSLEMVVGLLGILKAGAGYVPLDTAQPAARLAAILADTRVAAVVAQEAQLGLLPPAGAPVVRLDAERPLLDSLPGADPGAAVRPDDLAYVIYTSGSTGQPKGIQVAHRSILNRLLWTIETHAFSPRDRFLQKTPYGFDASIWELFVPLLVGARLIVARPGGHQDVRYLAQVIAEEQVTVLQLVPSMLAVLLEAADPSQLSSLRQVFAGGEVLARGLKERFFEVLDAELHNLYGPTEASIDVAAWRCDPAPGTPVPIGRPIANTSLYVLDLHLDPVPPGVPGQLYAAGAGLARGYLGRAGLTAEKFLPNPFASEPGARMYATGDLVHQLSDGSIQFLGRVDAQVKLRGFRIELGEVEQALRRAPAVREAAAAVQGAGDRDARLVAYVVGQDGAQVDAAAVRSSVETRLPYYMVPAAFVVLEELPRLPSGKVDRRALPEPEPAPHPGGEAEPPRTGTERRLAALWSEVLPRAPSTAGDDFFELGGNSLLAILLASRVRDAFGIDVALPAMFELSALRALAARVDELRGEPGPADRPITRRSREGELPLSFAQQRLWFLEHFVPGRPYYNVPIPIRLRGPLDLPALRRSLSEITRRHEVLRATFPEVEGRPVQVFAPRLEVEPEVTDASRLPEAEVRALVEGMGQRVFDLAAGPLVRAGLLRLGENDHLLLVVLHHIVGDGWSTQLLVRELTALYRAFSAGLPSPLPDPPVQYLDYAIWQRERLQGEHLARELRHWEERLRGAPAVLVLPADRARPAVQSYRSGHARLVLDGRARAELEALGRSRGATLFMTLLAGLVAVLHRHTGQEDLVVGAPVAGRLRRETEELVGFFVNTLPIRCDLSGDPSFGELLGRVRERTLEAFAHQELPFEKLVEELETERDLSRTPLFQVMFAFQGMSLPAAEAGDLTLAPVLLDVSPTRCDLTLYLLDTGAELRGSFEYVDELFDPQRMERMAGHLERLLAGAAAAPHRRISELPLLGDGERRQLEAFNATAQAYPGDAAYPRLFQDQVRRTPAATAAVCGEQELTYSELDRAAGKLARALLARGAGPEAVVGVLAERGLPPLTALLGILAAGAAYLPLDPAAPPARLATMLGQSRCRLVLTTSALRPALDRALGSMAPGQVPGCLLLDRPLPKTAGRRHPGGGRRPRSLAYVIFTSGSTGVPKGAMVEERSMLNHLHAKVRELGLTASDRIAQNASLSFDISIWQLLAGLLVGAQVHVLDDDVAHDPGRLLDAVARARITVLEVVPSMLSALLDHLDAAGPPATPMALRWLVATGEALPPALCARWFERFPAVPVMNAYGPTECADDVTHHVASAPAPDQRVPIGRPIMNTRLYVLRDSGAGLDACPLGAAGELFVGGDGVGRGYAGDPGRTAAAFLPDPFGEAPGARMYRTGDLVRQRADGPMEHLGRTDLQVKVRGHRIELEEVEAALAAHPGVAQAAVAVHGDQPGQARLTAYYVERRGGVTVEELRQDLQGRLPPYMLPAAFVRLGSLPRTASGKVDRGALPVPDARPELEERYRAPSTPAEILMARVWAELLGLDRVGVDDNFFGLGGHSLLAMQLTSRLRRAFRLEVPLAAVFQSQTVARLTRALAAAEPRPGHLDRVAELAMRVEAMSREEVRTALAERRA